MMVTYDALRERREREKWEQNKRELLQKGRLYGKEALVLSEQCRILRNSLAKQQVTLMEYEEKRISHFTLALKASLSQCE